jgi:hypothetical protein
MSFDPTIDRELQKSADRLCKKGLRRTRREADELSSAMPN